MYNKKDEKRGPQCQNAMSVCQLASYRASRYGILRAAKWAAPRLHHATPHLHPGHTALTSQPRRAYIPAVPQRQKTSKTAGRHTATVKNCGFMARQGSFFYNFAEDRLFPRSATGGRCKTKRTRYEENPNYRSHLGPGTWHSRNVYQARLRRRCDGTPPSVVGRTRRHERG